MRQWQKIGGVWFSLLIEEKNYLWKFRLVLICVDSCWLVSDSCWFVLTCVGLVLIRVDSYPTRVNSCWLVLDLCWLVSDSCWFVLIHVDLCWHSCIRIDLIQNALHMKKRLHARKTTRGFLKTKKKSRIDYRCIFILPLRSDGINRRLQNLLNFSYLPRFYHYHYSLHTIEYFSSIFLVKG